MVARFRVWDKNQQIFREVRGLFWDEDNLVAHFSPIGSKFDDSFTTILTGSEYHLMQSTGLKDKNGVEIFEGDIVRFKFKNETRIGFVEYVRSSFLINAGEIICDNKIRHSFSNSSSEEHEVIGNIYENSGLMEELN